MDMFGLCVYSKLQKNYHQRDFDYSEPFAADIAASKENGVWNKLSWKDGDLRVNNRFTSDSHQYNFQEKHTEMNVILEAISQDRPFVFAVFGKTAQTFKRIVIDRLDMTVAEAKRLKGEDWEMAKNAQQTWGEAKATPSAVKGEPVMVFDATCNKDIDLSQVAQFVDILFVNKQNNTEFTSTINPQDFRQLTRVKACSDPDSRYTARVVNYISVG
jgi:hypothetical protein